MQVPSVSGQPGHDPDLVLLCIGERLCPRPGHTHRTNHTAAPAIQGKGFYKAILREIPQLDDDKPLRALLASSIDSNVDACLQIMQHRIDLVAVRAPWP